MIAVVTPHTDPGAFWALVACAAVIAAWVVLVRWWPKPTGDDLAVMRRSENERAAMARAVEGGKR